MVAAAEQPADNAMMLMRAQPANTAMSVSHATHASRTPSLKAVKTCRMRAIMDILANARVGMSSTRPANNAWSFERVSDGLHDQTWNGAGVPWKHLAIALPS